MGLTAADGVEVESVALALKGCVHASFGDDTGLWAAVDTINHAVGRWGNQGGVRSCIRELEKQGRVRRHPSGADFYQPVAP